MRLRRSRLTRERLDGTVVEIEFLLIAVIQGLAITTLAVESESVIGELEWEYIPYVAAGFVLILNFWSLAIIHSVSFISWPFDIVHTLLYLLAAFVEVAAFAQITHPAKWFVFMLVFFLISFVLYLWDAKMVRDHREDFQDTPARAALYAHIDGRQRIELRLLLPAALVFHGLIVLSLWLWPDLIMGGEHHIIVVLLQLLTGLVFLAGTVRSFRERERLITACVEEE